MGTALAILTNRYVMIPLLAFAMLWGVYTYGKSVARGECHDAQLLAQIASLHRDISAAAQAQELERAQSAALEAQRQQLESQVKDYEAALKSRPDPACTLSADDIDRLSGKRRK